MRLILMNHSLCERMLMETLKISVRDRCQNLVLSYDFALVGYRNMVPSHLLEQLTKFLWDTNTGPGES